MTSALSGIRVLEITTGIAGPLAGMLLADFGAEVVRVEPPGGDPDRDRPGFAMWQRGKRRITLNPARAGDRADMLRLAGGADLCLASPAMAASWADGTAGFAAAATARNRRLVYLCVTPYLGGAAPWAGGAESGALLAAATGSAARQSSSDGGPVDPVYPHILYLQGIWAACCGTAALTERESSGSGQVVTVGGVHGAMAASPAQLVVRPGEPDPDTAVGPGGPSPTYTRYRCADGRWLFLAALTPKFRLIALDVLGFTDLLARARTDGTDAVVGPAHRSAVRPRFAAAFGSRTCAEWVAAFTAAGCPVAPLADRDRWLDHPQIAALGMAVQVRDPGRGDVVMPGNPIVLSATPPLADSLAVQLSEPGQQLPDWPPLPPPPGVPPRRAGPLAGVRVLDAGVVLAGPYAGTLLAELGAEVIKVEIPDGDSFRQPGFSYIRGQRGLALDLQSASGQDVVRRLARGCDIVIDNYRPGVAARLGLSYEQLVPAAPQLISLSISAFGDRGPLRGEAGFDPILQAMSGIMAAQGGDGEPVMLTLAVNDVAAACLTALAACIALLYRERGGSGQRGSVSLAGASVLMQCEELMRLPGRAPAPRGGPDYRGPGPADRYYQCRDGWIRVAATSTTAASALARLAGPTAGNGTSSRSAAAGDQLGPALESFFAARTVAEAAAVLHGQAIPAAAARLPSDFPADPELVSWRVHERISTGAGPEVLAAGRMAAFSRTEREAALIPPGVGQHSADVLREAGFGDAEIAGLVSEDIVRLGEPMTIGAAAAYR